MIASRNLSNHNVIRRIFLPEKFLVRWKILPPKFLSKKSRSYVVGPTSYKIIENIFCFEDWKAWFENNDLYFIIESFLSDDCMFLVRSASKSEVLKPSKLGQSNFLTVISSGHYRN